MASFGATHSIPFTSISAVPEPDPNDPPGPAEGRLFDSPEDSPRSVVAWVDGTGGPAGFGLYLRAGSRWLLLGAKTATVGQLSAEIAVPPNARLYARVTSGAFVGALSFAFRSPETKLPDSVTGVPLVGDRGVPVYVINELVVESIGGVATVNAPLGPAEDGLPVRLAIEDRFPPEIGQRASEESMSVVLASDATADVSDRPARLLGIVLADQGSAAALAGSWPVRLTDGSQFATVTSRISTANSTATPLAGGATFTGTYEEVTQYATISVQVFADVASAIDGLKVEFSTDGTSLDNDDTISIPAAKGKVFTFGANARYMRVRYANGASLQSAFRLQTIFHHAPPKPSSHKLTVDLVDEDDAELVRAVLAARKPDGTYTNVGADAGGNLIVTTPSQAADESGFIFGRVVLASTTPTALRATTYTEQAANARRSVVSTSASDTALGTGARAVRIVYLDVAMNGPFEEVVPTSGLTPVDTVATNICFVERYEVPLGSYGSGLTNAGTLNLKAAAAGGGATVWSIAAGDKQAFGAHHYVPSGKSARITGFACGIKGADTAGFEIRQGDPTSSQPAAEVVVSDHLRCPAGAQAPMRIYSSPIEVDGPARLTIYVLPDSTSSRTYYASFDYFDEEQ